MNGVGGSLRDVGQGLVNRVQAGFTALQRTSRSVAMLRGLVFGCLLVASALAASRELVLSLSFLAAVAFALLSALLPRTRIVSLTIVAIAGLWFVTTWEEPPSAWRVLAVAALLYVGHTSAALAAVLPHDTAVSPVALRRLARRVLAVLGVSAFLGVMGMALAGQSLVSTGVLGPVVGVLISVVIAGIIARQLRRRG